MNGIANGGSAKKERKRRPQGAALAKVRAAEGMGKEERQLEVARLLLERKNYRQIMAALLALPPGRRPAKVSLGTISRDVKALREAWAAERGRLVEELVGEEVARLNALEGVWWPKAMEAGDKATDKVLAIQRQRAALLGLGGSGGRGAVQVTAGAMAAAGSGGVNESGPLPTGAQVKVLIEYVDDRRDLGKYG